MQEALKMSGPDSNLHYFLVPNQLPRRGGTIPLILNF